jgi:hypothetical protein
VMLAAVVAMLLFFRRRGWIGKGAGTFGGGNRGSGATT